MKILIAAIVLYFSYKVYRAAKKFFTEYELVIFSKDDLDDIREMPDQIDLRGTPTHMCVCGSEIFDVKVVFDNYEISTYFLDMECSNCGNLATAPTPIDRESIE